MDNGWCVLIVEDNDDSFHVFEEALAYHNRTIDVERASSGEEVGAALGDCLPNLVILDLELPGKDGWQVLGDIRADERLSGVTVIATTAYHSANVAAQAREMGFDGYFPKPIDVFTFGAEIEAIMQSG